MITINNWLDKDLHEFLKDQYLHRTPHYFNQRSDPHNSSHGFFYISEFNRGNVMNLFLHLRIEKLLNKKLNFLRTYLNIQHENMNGDWHYDDGEMTCMYMVTGDGNFEIKDEASVLFEENKLICFSTEKLHRGLAPSKGTRITWVTKTEIIT
jgi:hypothetical protein|tara:strand:- start:169 stop:624 length:456 start_codon:yes stop_codon:yes gene_type:complete